MVFQWFSNGKWYHITRDRYSHCSRIPTGPWTAASRRGPAKLHKGDICWVGRKLHCCGTMVLIYIYILYTYTYIYIHMACIYIYMLYIYICYIYIYVLMKWLNAMKWYWNDIDEMPTINCQHICNLDCLAFLTAWLGRWTTDQNHDDFQVSKIPSWSSKKYHFDCLSPLNCRWQHENPRLNVDCDSLLGGFISYFQTTSRNIQTNKLGHREGPAAWMDWSLQPDPMLLTLSEPDCWSRRRSGYPLVI